MPIITALNFQIDQKWYKTVGSTIFYNIFLSMCTTISMAAGYPIVTGWLYKEAAK